MTSVNYEDTICAPATQGGGAIGIIRVSGPSAIDITDSIFQHNGNTLKKAAQQTIHYGNIVDEDGAIVDEVLVSIFKAPHSYTGENCTEISCHGSKYIINRILELLIKKGCRQATPGEYTQRAFMNGKMDLSQAEAVADLIASTNKATHKMALGQLKGNLSNELATLRNKLLNMTSMMELELDFSDQDVTFADREELMALAEEIKRKISSMLKSFATGRAIKQGIPVVIVGKTNVGKSTLLNKLLGEEKAIVSSIHGTTRDVIEDILDIKGITFRFIDTAGIRDTDNEIEQIGIERTMKKLDEATIVLWVIDEEPTDEELEYIKDMIYDKKFIIVKNKIDISARSNYDIDLTTIPHSRTISISAKNGQNIDLLENAIYEIADIPEIQENSVIITNTRHYEALLTAHECITNVIAGICQGLTADLLSEDLRLCISHLGDIIGGSITSEECLHNVFQNFCIGK